MCTKKRGYVRYTRYPHSLIQGVPFEVVLLLKRANEDQFLFFDGSRCEWRWDLKKLQSYDITRTAVDLVIDKFQSFSPECRTALSYAAMIGRKFSLSLLVQILAAKSEDEVRDTLQPAIVANFLTFE